MALFELVGDLASIRRLAWALRPIIHYGSASHQLRFHAVRITTAHARGDLEELVDASRAQSEVPGADTLGMQLQAALDRVLCSSFRGDLDEALDRSSELLASARSCRPWLETRLRTNRLIHLMLAGRWEEAARESAGALRGARGDLLAVGLAEACDIDLARFLGRLDEARFRVERLGPHQRFRTLVQLPLLRAQAGDLSGALEQHVAGHRPSAPPYALALAGFLHAELLAASGRVADAREVLAPAIDVLFPLHRGDALQLDAALVDGPTPPVPGTTWRGRMWWAWGLARRGHRDAESVIADLHTTVAGLPEVSEPAWRWSLAQNALRSARS
ncbi:MAG: hypothetical protein KC621_09995 [Myxococcales bacterium]|nr:hypothetical protein [Myxococcales bacterium]